MSYEKVIQANEVVIGTKQTLKAVKNGEVKELIIAADVDEKIREKVVSTAAEYNVPVTEVDSMKKLGKACGIDVGAAAVAIKG